ncbi:hypothetical protein Tco_0610514 [Tanacetum coccineum]
MSTDIVKLDLFDGGSFKRWQKKPWLNPVNVSSSEMTISFDVATSSMLCRIHSWTYLAQNKYAKVIGNLMYAMTCTRPDIAYAVVSWGSKKQSCLTDFTMAAEVVALDSCYKEAEWLRDFYGNNLNKIHLSEYGSETASYELKDLALKHSKKPRYRPMDSFNESHKSGLNEREE